MTQAYPLQWPLGRPRKASGAHKPGRFSRKETVYRDGNSWQATKEMTIYYAIKRLQAEIDRIGGRNAVISTNVETRLDGTPRSDRRAPDDPAAALYFQLAGKPHCMPCDTYDRVADNIAAIAAHIKATRAIERHGVASLAEMFTGFQALPPPTWWTDLGLRSRPASLEEAEAAWKRIVKEHHPDRGGNGDIAARANQAIAEARKEL